MCGLKLHEISPHRGGGYRGGYYGRSPVSAFINFSDLFYYWGPGYGRRRDAILRRPDEMTFFESIFSFGAPLHPRLGSLSQRILPG